jgi:enoyl-CoA hydratase
MPAAQRRVAVKAGGSTAMGDGSTIDVSEEGLVTTVRLSRPEKRNALNVRMVMELCEEFERSSARRALIVTGDEKAFSSGTDLSEAREPVVEGRSLLDALGALAALPVATIAAIEGHCLGGGLLLALACDFRIAAETALLGAPEILRGTFFGTTGTWRLPRIVGPARAKELLLLGKPVDAVTAERWGLVTRVVSTGHALDVAMTMALELCERPALALASTKRLIDRSLDISYEAAMASEEDVAALLVSSHDASEGRQAFMEKRKPEFLGR